MEEVPLTSRPKVETKGASKKAKPKQQRTRKQVGPKEQSSTKEKNSIPFTSASSEQPPADAENLEKLETEKNSTIKSNQPMVVIPNSVLNTFSVNTAEEKTTQGQASNNKNCKKRKLLDTSEEVEAAYSKNSSSDAPVAALGNNSFLPFLPILSKVLSTNLEKKVTGKRKQIKSSIKTKRARVIEGIDYQNESESEVFETTATKCLRPPKEKSTKGKSDRTCGKIKQAKEPISNEMSPQEKVTNWIRKVYKPNLENSPQPENSNENGKQHNINKMVDKVMDSFQQNVKMINDEKIKNLSEFDGEPSIFSTAKSKNTKRTNSKVKNKCRSKDGEIKEVMHLHNHLENQHEGNENCLPKETNKSNQERNPFQVVNSQSIIKQISLKESTKADESYFPSSKEENEQTDTFDVTRLNETLKESEAKRDEPKPGSEEVSDAVVLLTREQNFSNRGPRCSNSASGQIVPQAHDVMETLKSDSNYSDNSSFAASRTQGYPTILPQCSNKIARCRSDKVPKIFGLNIASPCKASNCFGDFTSRSSNLQKKILGNTLSSYFSENFPPLDHNARGTKTSSRQEGNFNKTANVIHPTAEDKQWSCVTQAPSNSSGFSEREYFNFPNHNNESSISLKNLTLQTSQSCNKFMQPLATKRCFSAFQKPNLGTQTNQFYCQTPKSSTDDVASWGYPRKLFKRSDSSCEEKSGIFSKGVGYKAVDAKVLIPEYNPLAYLNRTAPKPLLLTPKLWNKSLSQHVTPDMVSEYDVHPLG